MVAVWGIHNDALSDELVEEGFISIGWSDIPDLRSIGSDRDSLKRALSGAYPEAKAGAIPVWAGILYRFGFEMKEGDYKDESKNLIVCPLPHDFSFMQKFYEGMRIIQALMDTDFKEPKPVDIPHPQHREAARVYWERRNFSVVEVLEATAKFAQPELLSTSEESPDIVQMSDDNSDTSMVLAPMPMLWTPN